MVPFKIEITILYPKHFMRLGLSHRLFTDFGMDSFLVYNKMCYLLEVSIYYTKMVWFVLCNKMEFHRYYHIYGDFVSTPLGLESSLRLLSTHTDQILSKSLGIVPLSAKGNL